MSLTSAQEQAVGARGNVLVIAGAGTGKTSTLVERCLDCLIHENPPASLDEILMVTFTDAAAAEMRQRIRERLQAQLEQINITPSPPKALGASERGSVEASERRSVNAPTLQRSDAPRALGGEGQTSEQLRWQEQLALFETAHIGTLHSFCLQLVRQHFYELELDPQLSVLAQEEARLLAEETLETQLQKYYSAQSSMAEAVQQLIQVQGRGSDRPIRKLLLKVHHYTQTLPDPAGWFDQQSTHFASLTPTSWLQWLLEGVANWRESALPFLQELAASNQIAATCAPILGRLQATPARVEMAAALEEISAAAKTFPEGKKGAWLDPLEDFLTEADFLASLVTTKSKTDPLVEDWNWARPQMITLLQLAREFAEEFTEAKRQRAALDFHDLEQYALRLLWNNQSKQPTKIARQWRQKLRFVFVDEYQDINAAQDKIIEALSREGAQANRFLVGDVKQSIYRFRLANPRIFQEYANNWHNSRGKVIPLVDNFRSREGLLQFINSLFATILQPELGGLRYDEQARLRFGAPEQRRALGAAADAGPCVELHLRLKKSRKAEEEDEETKEALAELIGLEDADKEARLVALRLRELKAQRYPVWDEANHCFRPIDWSDMAILLRSPARKAERYAKEFSRLNIPLLVARGGFYDSMEISDLLSLLKLLDNPLQDIPALAVLHSPLVGLTINELATVRLAGRGPFWTTLGKWREGNRSKESGLLAKVSTFLEQFAQWRRLARQVSLSRCLDAILSETHYAAWLLTQPRGEQRHAHVQRFLGLAQQFDQFQRQGLFRFLRFIEAQQLAETEPEVEPVSQENSVRLMSIHQSKGLEFPVVAVADLGKPFNVSDLRADLILDEQFGLCPQIKPPHAGQRYPSLPYWLASRRQHREMLGEELRLLYVAMTRARDRLILSGTVPETRFEKRWKQNGELGARALSSAGSYCDWLGYWFSQNFKMGRDGEMQGENAILGWVIHEETKLLGTGPETVEETAMPVDSEVWQTLEQRLAWEYPFVAATRQPAKASVTALRRLAAEQAVEEGALWPEARERIPRRFDAPCIPERPDRKRTPRPEPVEMRRTRANGLLSSALSSTGGEGGQQASRQGFTGTAEEIGAAHHRFLQLVSLDRVGNAADLAEQAESFREEGSLRAEEIALLDFDRLAGFWQSELGRQVLGRSQFVRRELVFTARFSPEELAALTAEPIDPNLKQEFVVVQGVADLAVLSPSEIWLIDFKTDAVANNELNERVDVYAPQLRLYARALSRIYQRPVAACWLYFLASQMAVKIEE